jgi:hypothetical protein
VHRTLSAATYHAHTCMQDLIISACFPARVLLLSHTCRQSALSWQR